MPVKIEKCLSVTLNELKDLQSQGYVVEATPHIGNLGARTLAALSLGFGIKLVDINIGEKDILFYPHCMISNRGRSQIAPGNVLSTHSKLISSNVSVVDFHTAEIRKQYKSIVTHAEWMRSRSNLVAKILEIIHRATNGMLWERYVDANGVVHRSSYGNPSMPGKIHKATSGPDEEGWLVPNPINILIDLVFAALESSKDVVYMISGESMYKYIHQHYRSFGPMDQLIAHLYDRIREFGLVRLPQNLQVNMVPLACLAHFSSPLNLKVKLEKKLQYFQTVTSNNKRAGAKLSEQRISKPLMQKMAGKRIAVLRELSQPLQYVSADPTTGIFYSQHDLIREGDGFYVSHQIMDVPVSQMQSMVQKMTRWLQ